MIFNNNTTSLGSINIPMAEGYDCSYGCALALVESARNDYAMFRAMLDADARELAIKNESTGYVAESQVSALHEAAISGIWNKIKQLFAKLVAKIKSIFHSFMARLNGLFMDTKKMIKKYQNEVLRKTNLGNMKVKYRKSKMDISDLALGFSKHTPSLNTMNQEWSEDKETRWENVTSSGTTGGKSSNASEYRANFDEAIWEDDSPTEYELKDIEGGIRGIITSLEAMCKADSKIKSGFNKLTTSYEKVVNEANKNANDAAKESKDKGENSPEAKAVTEANHTYDMAVVWQEVTMVDIAAFTEAFKTDFAQKKAVFTKAAAANDKKLEEQSIYLDAVAEAAEQEVEDVITGALKSDGDYLSSTSIAPTNVMDADVSNDAEKLVYDKKQFYSTDGVDVDPDGSIDTNINSKEESAFFGALLY